MLYAGDHVSSHPVLVIRVRMIRNNPGNALVCPGLQAPMLLLLNSLNEHVTKIFHMLKLVMQV